MGKRRTEEGEALQHARVLNKAGPGGRTIILEMGFGHPVAVIDITSAGLFSWLPCPVSRPRAVPLQPNLDPWPELLKPAWMLILSQLFQPAIEAAIPIGRLSQDFPCSLYTASRSVNKSR
jgi:hypothetical protein